MTTVDHRLGLANQVGGRDGPPGRPLCSARPAVAPYLRRQPDMAASIVAHLRALANPRDAEGQRRFGITPGVELLGIRAPVLREIARAHRRDHALALELWTSAIS